MTENVKHVDVLLEKWRVRYNELIQMDRTYEAEQVIRCINDFKGLQREAAGGGGVVPDGWKWEERGYDNTWKWCHGPEVPQYHEQEKWIRNATPLYTAPRPTGTDKVARLPDLWERAANTTIGTDDASETQRRILQMCADHLRAAITTPASAEPGGSGCGKCTMFDFFNGRSCALCLRTVFSPIPYDARGGGEADAEPWRCEWHGSAPMRGYHLFYGKEVRAYLGDTIKSMHIEELLRALNEAPKDRYHPTPAALDAEKDRRQGVSRPVAWQYRAKFGDDYTWHLIEGGVNTDYNREHYEVRALYACPTPESDK